MSHADSVRCIKQLLYFDVLVRAEDGDAERTAQSCLVALNVGRSLGDEPSFMSPVIRVLCQLAAERAVERLLAQCELSEATLKKLQVEFSEEAAQPLLLLAFRSCRAVTHEDLNRLEAMQVNRRGLRLRDPYGLPDEAINLNDALRARACHAGYLRYLTALVEIAKLRSGRPASTTRREFGRGHFAFPELEFVNRYAYFDYQREKVFLRTSKTLRRVQHVRSRTPVAMVNEVLGKILCHNIVVNIHE